jgi:hypothetical protein
MRRLSIVSGQWLVAVIILLVVGSSAEAGWFWRVTHPFAARRAAASCQAPASYGQACSGPACAVPVTAAMPAGRAPPPYAPSPTSYRAP